MPRTRKCITNRNSKTTRLYQEAYKELQKGKTVRHVAKMFDLNHVSLTRYKKKRELAQEGTPIEEVTMGYSSARKALSVAQETELENYAIKSAEIYFGLSTRDLRKMAHDLTVRYNTARPPSWDANGAAGIDWFKGFLKRHPEIAVRCAQATSYVQETGFNKWNVHEFYDYLEKALDEHKFEPQDIYIVDETGIMADQRRNRILPKKNRLGSLSTAERETIVTVTVAANAIGDVIEPMFTFSTDKTPGWMQEEDLLAFLQHFRTHLKLSSSDHRVLLLLDNQTSHVSIECIDYCHANGIVVLSFPPYCNRKLHPLACSVYGPFKKAVNTACDEWLRSNPGVTITIYDIPKIVSDVLPQAVPPTNVQAGFRCTGIYPFNREIFSDSDFAHSNDTEMVLVDEMNSVIND